MLPIQSEAQGWHGLQKHRPDRIWIKMHVETG